MILFGTNVCCLMMQCFVATFLSEVPNVAPITALGHCKGMGHPPATMGISTEVCWRNSKEQWIASFPFAMDLSDFSHFFCFTMFFCHGTSLLKFGLSKYGCIKYYDYGLRFIQCGWSARDNLGGAHLGRGVSRRRLSNCRLC